ncbi:Bor family protein [Vibrio quintilis]|uniref:Bor protein n=1 Tax=Vibrio quintilis TaxID=1117707 RepID=A0A1M7YR23_9VIBR|nr:Bor family protein [Vibrio quintilis]SHO55082.1 Bor protein [Vibrio quintilis]
MKRKILPAILCAVLLGGCSAQTFLVNGSNGEVPTSQKSQHFFVYGIGQEQETNAAEVCGGVDKVIKVEAQQTFINGLLGVITFGIYTPRDAKVYCKM